MDTLIIEQTEFTPYVCLSTEKRVFEIKGESTPENSRKFYTPILDWLNSYKMILFWEKDKFGKTAPVTFNFKFEYFNSSTAKYIMEILMLLDEFHKDGYDITVNWHFENEDEDMKDSGIEFSKLVKVPVNLIEA